MRCSTAKRPFPPCCPPGQVCEQRLVVRRVQARTLPLERLAGGRLVPQRGVGAGQRQGVLQLLVAQQVEGVHGGVLGRGRGGKGGGGECVM